MRQTEVCATENPYPPGFFVSVAFKEFSVPLSCLESSLGGDSVDVDSKRVAGIAGDQVSGGFLGEANPRGNG